MKTTTISNQGRADVIAVSSNIANVSTSIFVMTVPRATTYDILNSTTVKGVPIKGFHIILDLNKADGSRISGASLIKLRTKSPASEDAQTHRALPYAIWREVSSLLQRNDDFKSTLASSTDLDTSGLRLAELRQFIIEVHGPDVVDWTKSYVQFDVQEHS